MNDEYHVIGFEIHAHVSQALWPGDGVICKRLSAPKWFPDMLFLVSRDDRVSELRPYQFGMFKGLR